MNLQQLMNRKPSYKELVINAIEDASTNEYPITRLVLVHPIPKVKSSLLMEGLPFTAYDVTEVYVGNQYLEQIKFVKVKSKLIYAKTLLKFDVSRPKWANERLLKPSRVWLTDKYFKDISRRVK